MQELQNNGAHPAGFAEYPFFKEDKMDNGIAIMEKEGMNLIDARALHDALEVHRDFSTWIKDRIEKYGFIEAEDFFKYDEFCLPHLASKQDEGFLPTLAKTPSTPNKSSKKLARGYSPDLAKTPQTQTDVQKTVGQRFSPNLGKTSLGGRPAINYLLTMDMAKELAMVENNEAGRKVRRYLIKIENEYRQIRSGDAQLSFEALAQLAEMKKEFGKWLVEAQYALEIFKKGCVNQEILAPVKDSHADMVRFGGMYLDITGKEGDYVEVRVAFKLFQHIQTVPLESYKFMIEIPYIFPEISLDRRSTRQPIFRGCLIK